MRLLCLAAFALCLLLTPAAVTLADDFEDCGNAEALLKTDPSRAAAACRRLAEQGVAAAQYNLALMYDNGYGVLQDYAEAVEWYRKAAEQGYAWAQNNLGGMYHEGHGVPQDYVQAYMWLNLAVAALPPGANRNNAVSGRDYVAKLMTPAQVEKAQELAHDWLAAHPNLPPQ